MNNANISRLKIMWILLVAALLGTSCIGEDLEDCPRGFRLSIKAVDANQNDITQSGEIDQVLLFVFDENQEIVKTFTINHNELNKPLDLKFDYPGPKELQIVAWANVGDRISMPDIKSVKKLTDLYAKLKNKPDQTGIVESPNDLFYGSLKVPVQYGSVDPAEDVTVTISRKTSQVHIGAYGLEFFNGNQKGEYTFELKESFDTYNENGGLVGSLVSYKPDATMDSKGNLTTPIFNTFPTEGDKPYTLLIRYNGKIIYTASKDLDGKPFIPEPGRLLNIIIKFDKLGGIVDIKIVLTPWNEIFQFVEI